MSPWLAKLMRVLGVSEGLILILQFLSRMLSLDIMNIAYKAFNRSPVGQILKQFEMQYDEFPSIVSRLTEAGDLTPEAAKDLSELYNTLGPISQSINTVFSLSYLQERIKKITDSVTGSIYQIYRQKYRPNAPDPNIVLGGVHLSDSIKGEIGGILARNGINDNDIQTVFAAMERPLDAATIVAAETQQVISYDTAITLLGRLGISQESADILLRSVPSSPDLTTMIASAQQNGFDNDLAVIFGTDEAMPKEWQDLVDKQGLSADWGLRTWRMRYTMPSLDIFLNAVRLGLVDQNEREVYYKAIGIPPKLYAIMDASITQQLSIPYAAQAFNANVIDEGTFREIIVKNGLGKVEEDIVVKLAKAQLNPQTNTNAVNQILLSLSDGYLDETTAKTMLIDSGLTDIQADLEINLAHYQRQYEYNKTVISSIQSAFKKGKINSDDALQQLIHIGIQPPAAQQYLTVWSIEATVSESVPTITDYKNMYKYKIITSLQQLTDGIIRNGYNPTDAARLAALFIAELGG